MSGLRKRSNAWIFRRPMPQEYACSIAVLTEHILYCRLSYPRKIIIPFFQMGIVVTPGAVLAMVRLWLEWQHMVIYACCSSCVTGGNRLTALKGLKSFILHSRMSRIIT